MSAFSGATLMITGGTGSFGNTVLKHFLTTDIGEIRIFSRDEKKQDDMRHDLQARYPDHLFILCHKAHPLLFFIYTYCCGRSPLYRLPYLWMIRPRHTTTAAIMAMAAMPHVVWLLTEILRSASPFA